MSTITLAICGVKGAGKSTTIRNLVDHFEAKDWFVRVCAPFAEGNEAFKATGGLIPTLKTEEGVLAVIAFLENAVRQGQEHFEADFAQAPNDHGLLLFDRHWMTVFCQYDDSCLQQKYWMSDFTHNWLYRAPPTVFIHTTPENTLERRKGQLDAMSGLQSPDLVRLDHARRLRLRNAHPEKFLAAYETPQATPEHILADLSQRIETAARNHARSQ